MQTVSKAWMDNAVKTVRPEMFVEIMLKAKDRDIVFTKEQITRYKQKQVGYLISESLPKNEINFSVINLDGSWDPQAPGSVEGLLEEQLPIIVRYGMMVNGAVEWIPAGTFYLTDWSTSADSHEATFIARDIMGGWNDRAFEGIHSRPNDNLGTEGTVAQYVDLVTEIAKLPAGIIVPDKYCPFETVFNPSTEDANLAQVFQILANAAGCALYIARDGKVYFKRFPVTLNSVNTIPSSEEYSNPTVERKTEPYKVVLVKRENKETYMVISENKGRTVRARCDIIGKYSSEGTLVRDFVIPRTEPELVESTKTDIFIRSGDTPIFNGEFLYYLADVDIAAMARFLGPAQTVSVSYRANPVLDIFDVVLVETKYNSAQVVITELEYNFNGAFTGNLKGVVLKEVAKPDPEQKPTLGKFVLGTDKLGG